MSQERIIVVEDERAQRIALERFLKRIGHQVDGFESGEEALESLRQNTYTVLITDLCLPKIDGLEVIRRARQIDDDLGVLLMTAYASVNSAVEALRTGAHDYLLKPLVLEDVRRKVENIIERRELLRENVSLRLALQDGTHNHEIVAESAVMQDVVGWIQRAASSKSNVIITGETGTGKEVVARNIHLFSPNKEGPFLPVNLSALPDNMAESELFGHERGAFTGAETRRDGILRAAGSGTVFLDEIAELSLNLQPKLLRALEAREVRAVGSDRPTPFHARILAATHRDLREMVSNGKFREDLYYRLNVIHIHVPSLRERPEDVPSLVRALLKRQTERLGFPPPPLSPELMQTLCAHHWRGNIREISNVLERALLLAEGGRIELEHLPRDIRDHADEGFQLQEAMDRFERHHITTVLRLCDGNRDAAAEALGISISTLYRRIEKLGLKGLESQRTASA